MQWVIKVVLPVCVVAGFACNNKQKEDNAPTRAPATETSAADHNRKPACLLVEEAVPATTKGAPGVEVVATGLEVPWGLAFLPSGDILVTERPGRLRRIHQGRLDDQPVATWNIDPAGEGGVLGIALDPGFAVNGNFFVYVTKPRAGRTQNQVERWRYDQGQARATMEGIVVDGIPAARFHNGGRIRLGADGMLYIGTGDAREPESSQERGSLAGKILRLQPNGNIPADNPWPNVAAFVTGLRNTQGFDWVGRERLVVMDHGPSGELGRSGHDEVSVVQAGANLGWPTIYGCQTKDGLVTPSITWERAVPPGGAAYYTGDAIPQWKNSLLVGVLGDKHLHRIVFEDGQPGVVARHEIYFHGDPPRGYGRLREVIQGPDGALYVTTSNCDGRGDCPPDKDKVLRLAG